MPTVSPINHIVVQTRQGNNIDNSQCFSPPSLWDRRNIEDLKRKYQLREFRSPVTFVYNCHGMTFASRRTSITDTGHIYKILEDDKYKEIPVEEVLPGDVVLYCSEEGDIEHSGVVISEPDPTFKCPQIVSKWGGAGEVIHYVNNSPYSMVALKYYRVME